MSISSINQFYVYVYLDPRKPGKFKYGKYEFGYEPFYVGKGYNQRFKIHLKESKLNKDPNKLKVNKIRKIRKDTNKDPIIIKYKENLLEESAFNLETKMIRTIGRIDLGTGLLTNLTDGGEGNSNKIVSNETKLKISKNHSDFSGNKNPMFGIIRKGKDNPNYGNKWSDKQKEKMSINKKGKNEGINNHFYGKKHTKQTKNKMSKSMNKFMWTILNIETLEVVKINNLHEYCKENNLSYDCMWKTFIGKNKQHKKLKIINRRLK